MRYQTDWEMVERIRELAAQGLTSKEIGQRVGKTPKAVQKYYRRHNITPGRRQGGQLGPENPSWNGGQTIDKNGYRLIRCLDHPNRNSNGYVREHRLVMESVLGRYLDPKEVVHHIDGDKLNNQPDNLEVFEENRIHLQHELTGRVPNWSEEGLSRIKAPKPNRKRPVHSQDHLDWLKSRPRDEAGRFLSSPKGLKTDES